MGIEKVKELVSDDDLRIKLHDYIVEDLQNLISELESEDFSTKTKWSEDEFKRRVTKVEELTNDLCTIQILLTYWGSEKQRQNCLLALQRITNANYRIRGGNVWIALRWYPVLLLLYYGGISAIAAGNYKKLFELMNIRVHSSIHSHNKMSLIQATTKVFSNINGDPFEIISGNRNHFVPRNEYLLKALKPKLNELLFLDSEYEPSFNQFEVMLALEYAHQTAGDSPEHINAPIGRFGYKRRGSDNPLAELIEEANTMKEDWPLFKAGLIGGSFDRFKKISSLLDERVNNLRWGF